MPPLEAALRGSEQIGFTILSLTVSLIAVLIPLLFMQDVVGRLFREFAITLSVTILVSAVVSLTLTPMMCSKILRHQKDSDKSLFYRVSENSLNWIIEQYATILRFVLKHQPATLDRHGRNAGADDFSVPRHSERLLPCAGYGSSPRHLGSSGHDFVSGHGESGSRL